MCQRAFVVLIVKNRGKLRAVDGGHTPVCGRGFHIFNPVPAQNQRPICLGVRVVLIENLLIDPHCFVKFIVAPKMIGAVVHLRAPFVVQLWQRLRRPAVLTLRRTLSRSYIQCRPAHLTFEYCHRFYPNDVVSLYFLNFFTWSTKNQARGPMSVQSETSH